MDTDNFKILYKKDLANIADFWGNIKGRIK